MATNGWNAVTLLGLQARKSSHKEFRFLLVAIKCLSAFLFHIVCRFSYRLLNDIFLSWYTLLYPPGGDCGFEEGGQWSGPGLPLASSHRDWRRPAQHRNLPVLFKGKEIIWIAYNWISLYFFLKIITTQGPVPLLTALLDEQQLAYCIMTF